MGLWIVQGGLDMLITLASRVGCKVELAVEWFEDRFVLLGLSGTLKVVLVCHCYREQGNVIRIISARNTLPSSYIVFALPRMTRVKKSTYFIFQRFDFLLDHCWDAHNSTCRAWKLRERGQELQSTFGCQQMAWSGWVLMPPFFCQKHGSYFGASIDTTGQDICLLHKQA